MKPRLRRLAIFISVFLFLFGGYAVYRFTFASRYEVPKDFMNARAQGALVAQTIVQTSNDLASGLEVVSALDKEWKYTEALERTVELAKKSIEIRTRAVELSAELEKMTRALESVKSVEARGVALEAISLRLQLINRLIDYSDGLLQLVDALRGRFTGALQPAVVSQLIERINKDVADVNDLDVRAQEAMKRFDELTK